jgi:hypothetical protein
MGFVKLLFDYYLFDLNNSSILKLYSHKDIVVWRLVLGSGENPNKTSIRAGSIQPGTQYASMGFVKPLLDYYLFDFNNPSILII